MTRWSSLWFTWAGILCAREEHHRDRAGRRLPQREHPRRRAGTSVSALVGEYLRSLTQREAELTRLRARWKEVVAEIERFRGDDRLGRDELHERAVH